MPFNKKKLDNFYESVSKHKSHFDKAQGLTTIITAMPFIVLFIMRTIRYLFFTFLKR